jgi:pimeloyl-ACP methyl ester carboxylesterase
MPAPEKSEETVVLIHGIFGSFFDMSLDMAYPWYALSRAGYDAQIVNYATMAEGGIDAIAARVWQKIQDRGLDRRPGQLHFVAHSMGGLIAASVVRQFTPANLGRVVMWGTPLWGSSHANSLNATPLLGETFRFFGGKAFLDLQVRRDADENPVPLQAVPPETGMIAGTKSIHPLAHVFMKDAEAGHHDGLVPIHSTRHRDLRDHCIMPVTHPGMLHSPGVIRQTAHFLRNGRFIAPA